MGGAPELRRGQDAGGRLRSRRAGLLLACRPGRLRYPDLGGDGTPRLRAGDLRRGPAGAGEAWCPQGRSRAGTAALGNVSPVAPGKNAEREPAEQEGDAAERGDSRQRANAGEGQQIETAGEQHGPGDEEPGGDGEEAVSCALARSGERGE